MNNENRSSRKDVIKNIAIIMLSVMLLLTFFSNTIMNLSLPQVQTVYASQGTISEQIRGSGTVNPAQRYEVTFDQKREIKKINFEKGQKINAGDVLFEFVPPDEKKDEATSQREQEIKNLNTEIESKEQELDTAKKTLADLEYKLRKDSLKLESGKSYFAEEQEITRAENELADLRKQLSNYRTNKVRADSANDKYKDAKERVDSITKEKETYTAMLSSADTDDMLDLTDEDAKLITDAKNAVTAAEKDYEEKKKKYEDLQKKVTDTDYQEQIRQKKDELDEAQAVLNGYYTSLYSADADADTSSIYISINTQNTKISSIEREISAINAKQFSESSDHAKMENAEKNMNKAREAVDAAKNKLAETKIKVKKGIKAKINDADERLNEAQNDLTAAEDVKKEADDAITEKEPELVKKISDQEFKIKELKEKLSDKIAEDLRDSDGQKIDLESTNSDIARQKQVIEKIEKKLSELRAELKNKQNETSDVNNEVKAKMGGEIESISVTVGETVNENSVGAVIFVKEKGYELEFSVKTEQAKKVRPGDKAEVTNWYWGEAIEAELKEIKPDTANPQTQKILVFSIKGNDIASGQSISLSMGSKGQSYPAVVPNNAIREDSNGKFILAMESKSSPLGNRYTAVRYDVQIVAKDDNNCAVNGLMGSEYIITTATRPIKAGEQIRPAD